MEWGTRERKQRETQVCIVDCRFKMRAPARGELSVSVVVASVAVLVLVLPFACECGRTTTTDAPLARGPGGRSTDTFADELSVYAEGEGGSWYSPSNKHNSQRHGINVGVWTLCHNSSSVGDFDITDFSMRIKNKGVARLLPAGIGADFFLRGRTLLSADGTDGMAVPCRERATKNERFVVQLSMDGGSTWMTESEAITKGFLLRQMNATDSESSSGVTDQQRVSLRFGHAIMPIKAEGFSDTIRLRVSRGSIDGLGDATSNAQGEGTPGPCFWSNVVDDREWPCGVPGAFSAFRPNPRVRLVWERDILWGETTSVPVAHGKNAAAADRREETANGSKRRSLRDYHVSSEEKRYVPEMAVSSTRAPAADLLEKEFRSDDEIFSPRFQSYVYSDPTSRSVSQQTVSSPGESDVEFGGIVYSPFDGSMASSVEVETDAIPGEDIDVADFILSYSLFDSTTGIRVPIAERPVRVISEPALAVIGCPPAVLRASGLTPNGEIFIMHGTGVLNEPFSFSTGVRGCVVESSISNTAGVQTATADRQGLVQAIVDGVTDCRGSYFQIIDLEQCKVTNAVQGDDVTDLVSVSADPVSSQCGAEANALYKGGLPSSSLGCSCSPLS